MSGNLDGQTLAPGPYNTGSSLAISSGDLTLNSGTTLEGRALTRIGAVTLAADTVTFPSP